jgi:hypothetical protein
MTGKSAADFMIIQAGLTPSSNLDIEQLSVTARKTHLKTMDHIGLSKEVVWQQKIESF